MRFTRWKRPGVLVAAPLLILAVTMPGVSAAGPASAAGVPGPVLKVIAAQHSITLTNFRGRVFLDPGMWIGAQGSPLQFDVQRASYTKPVTITQVIYPPFGGTVHEPLPASLLDGWNGLKDFLTLTARNSAGKVVVTQRLPFCPNTFDPQKVGPGSSATEPYPQECGNNPFTLGQVWGLENGWATNPVENRFSVSEVTTMPPGVYRVTGTISPVYTKLFHIPASDATATVTAKVVKGRCCLRAAQAPKPAHRAPVVPTLSNPPQNALPDLVPLPSWSIFVSHPKKQTHDFLDFSATVWIGGNGPLDVEGFRSHGSPVMKAYQYFWSNGHIIGRAPAGTMGFDSKHGHNHWHFEQFAKYALLNSDKTLAMASHKVGFCIAPTDGINLMLKHATWQPQFGIGFGNCGSPTSLSVSEQLPLGWGDTYQQTIAGQSFDITKVPNGTYYIQVTANPEKILFETSTSNDVSLRKVILGGTPGHRTVQVPPWHGLDPEH